jgi:NAD(P)-dependent dehydrogenase (short-subunit alcohol dehydrogenase family)
VDTLAGVAHLAPLGSDWLPPDASLAEWRAQLELNQKSLFTLLHSFGEKLSAGAHVLSASSLGGLFNREGSVSRGLSIQGGDVGLLKSLREERPELRAKAVDVDPALPAPTIADLLCSEIQLVGGRQEVGYPEGRRTIFATVPEREEPQGEGRAELKPGSVVVATGGAKGITAEVLRELALPGSTLVIIDVVRLTEEEPAALQSLRTAAELQRHFIGEVRAGRLKWSPAEVQREVRSILSAREMLSNIASFREGGASVEYHSVDVTDEESMRQLLDSVYQRHAAIDGVVHGAGIIEDKLLSDKTGESWSRVVETKVIGLLLLQKYLRAESLKFLTVFSSVAGRYGNSGQTDYATANELMNRLCSQLNAIWGDRVRIRALSWGPWAATTHGSGMVSPATEAKFAEKGVSLVTPEIGRHLFRNELLRSDGPVEVVLGEGPWEQGEAEIGRIEKGSSAEQGPALAPLLRLARVTPLDKGAQAITYEVDRNHAYLQDHLIDGTPVLPAAVALEMMAEGANALWPGWKVVEARECRLLKGVKCAGAGKTLTLAIDPPTQGSGSGFEVGATLRSQENGKTHLHYRSLLRLAQQWPDGLQHEVRLPTDRQLTVADAYDEWLFHGPRFQVIAAIDGLSDRGIKSRVCSTAPARWLATCEPEHDRWLFDPALVDAAAQMATLWTLAFRNEFALPSRFGRVVRFCAELPERLHVGLERSATEEPHLVRADVYFTDEKGQVLLLIEDMECVSSTELNRLSGTAEFAGDTRE